MTMTDETRDTRVEDYLAATRSPVAPKQSPRDTSGDLFENFPRLEGETTSDYRLRAILDSQAKWREIQRANGTHELPAEKWPRLIASPEQFYA
jgi:hypothetical protein